MKRKHILLLTLVVWVLASTASAVLHEDDFYATLEGKNVLVDGGGTGYEQGAWFEYGSEDDPGNWWWNQWFYDDYPVLNRYKEISYGGEIRMDTMLPPFLPPGVHDDMFRLNSWESRVVVALNWSTPLYSQDGPTSEPPMPALNSPDYIVRKIVFDETEAWLPWDTIDPWIWNFGGEHTILDYNPEWVSIDVRVFSWVDWDEWMPVGFDPQTGDEIWDWVQMGTMPVPVTIDGWITHECIPEPTTMLLLGLGALALLRKKP